MENILGSSKGKSITEALVKLKSAPKSDGINLVNIAKKLSSKKFGKK